LSEFEDDETVFNRFLVGRHDLEVHWGHARDRLKGIEDAMVPYLSHKLRRIREWAQYEIDYARSEISLDEQLDAEMDRT